MHFLWASRSSMFKRYTYIARSWIVSRQSIGVAENMFYISKQTDRPGYGIENIFKPKCQNGEQLLTWLTTMSDAVFAGWHFNLSVDREGWGAEVSGGSEAAASCATALSRVSHPNHRPATHHLNYRPKWMIGDSQRTSLQSLVIVELCDRGLWPITS